jgi:nucleotide-binding universal stress UspA family protein
MAVLTSILVDIDASAAHHPALDQAISLATRCGARIKIVDVLPWVPQSARHYVTPDRERDLLEHRRERLQSIADALHDVSATTAVLRGRPGTALVQEVVHSGHDLLVRSHGRDEPTRPRPFRAIDMELLRQCPCPLWLVAHHETHRPWRILAAVHTSGEELVEQGLNEEILDWALMLYGFGDAHLTIFQAWTVFGASILKSHMPPEEFTKFSEATRRREEDALARFVQPFAEQLKSVAVESVYGEPDEAIVRFVEANGINVVVMGTVARAGIAGVIMGNTAERVLQRLRGSVVAIKPPEFPGIDDEGLTARNRSRATLTLARAPS